MSPEAGVGVSDRLRFEDESLGGSTGSDSSSLNRNSTGRGSGALGRGSAGALVRFRYRGIWCLVAALFLLSAIVAPASLKATSLLAIMPFVAFLAIAAMGESLVVMVGGLDLSISAVIAGSAVTLVAVSGVPHASPGRVVLALALSFAFAAIVGLVNGFLITVVRLNFLLVTLSVNTIVTGVVLLYLRKMHFENSVAPMLQHFGAIDLFGLNISLYVALALVIILTVVLNYTPLGRRLRAIGANPVASWLNGMRVERAQIGVYVVAALLYAIAGVLLSAFSVNPSKDVGAPYLLAPIVAVVLGTGSLAGGGSSMVATFAGALFLTQLSQMLKTAGASGFIEYILTGLALAAGIMVSSAPLRRLLHKTLRDHRLHRMIRSRRG